MSQLNGHVQRDYSDLVDGLRQGAVKTRMMFDPHSRREIRWAVRDVGAAWGIRILKRWHDASPADFVFDLPRHLTGVECTNTSTSAKTSEDLPIGPFKTLEEARETARVCWLLSQGAAVQHVAELVMALQSLVEELEAGAVTKLRQDVADLTNRLDAVEFHDGVGPDRPEDTPLAAVLREIRASLPTVKSNAAALGERMHQFEAHAERLDALERPRRKTAAAAGATL